MMSPVSRAPKNATKKKTRKPKAKPVEEVLFSRDNGKKVPIKVLDAADLWLDMFMGISGMTAGDEVVPMHARIQWLEDAAVLADKSLALYEDRWPHMAHGE